MGVRRGHERGTSDSDLTFIYRRVKPVYYGKILYFTKLTHHQVWCRPGDAAAARLLRLVLSVLRSETVATFVRARRKWT